VTTWPDDDLDEWRALARQNDRDIQAADDVREPWELSAEALLGGRLSAGPLRPLPAWVRCEPDVRDEYRRDEWADAQEEGE